MKKFNLKIILLLAVIFSLYTQNSDSIMIQKIFDNGLMNGQSYQMLDYLSNKIGARLSGSPKAAAAVEWGYQQMKSFGFDTVYLQAVMVPHWVRGAKEKASIVNSKYFGNYNVDICALGGSVATPENGLVGKVIEVQSLEELKKLGKEKIKGKIVFFNRRFDPKIINTFEAYGKAVDQRGGGASEGAKFGAIGVIVRSMNPEIDDYPHTGGMFYEKSNTIPACAISTLDAEYLSKALKQEPDLNFYFKQNSEWLPDVLSYNVVGELRGTTHKNEIITVGGHLDSWDTGDGAHDDGAGCVQSIDALRLLKISGYKPKRTLRAVLFMNEENGLRGGRKYAELAELNKENHIAAIESDKGGFNPKGFSIGTPISEKEGATISDKKLGAAQYKKISSWISLLERYGLYLMTSGEGGADIGPLAKFGTVLIELEPEEQRYFRHHHTPVDTFNTVNQRELEAGSASMSALIYLLSEYGT